MTWIVGGATSGYCATGSRASATSPISGITIDRTVAKTGRSTKKRANIPLPRDGLPVAVERLDGVVDPRALEAEDDQEVARREAPLVRQQDAAAVVEQATRVDVPSQDHVAL